MNILPANTMYQCGLMLLHLYMYFSKDELSKSLILPSTKSMKPALDQAKAGTIIGKWLYNKHIMSNMCLNNNSFYLMKQRFGQENVIGYEEVSRKSKPKCRDTKNYVLVV